MEDIKKLRLSLTNAEMCTLAFVLSRHCSELQLKYEKTPDINLEKEIQVLKKAAYAASKAATFFFYE